VKTRHLALAAVALLVITLLATGAARADTFTYTYTSQQQLDLGNQPCDPCRVALSFTVATALAPSSTFTWAENGSTFANPLNPILNMSSDNFGGLSSAVDPSSIQVVTDKSGNIVSWGFTINSAAFPVPSGTCTGLVASLGDESSPVASSIVETITMSNCTDVFVDNTDTAIFTPLILPGAPPDFWTEKTNVTTTMNAPEPSTLMLVSIGVLLACMKSRRSANSFSR
jgi:PEP-CTERM motif